MYPKLPSLKRLGDPICDQYAGICFTNGSLIAIADGCNWGEIPKLAAQTAVTLYTNYLNSHYKELKTTHDIIKYSLRSFLKAHQKIISAVDKDTLFLAGTTTILGGMIVELETPIDG